MRKMLLVSIVLLVAAQAFAGTVTMSVTKKAGTGTDRWATIGYSADANVSGFGLKIYTTDPGTTHITGVNDYNVGESTSAMKGYGIFPGSIVIESNGTVSDWNTPVAPSSAPGAAGTGLDTNTIIAELGALYVDGNRPPLSGTLLSVKVNGDCNVCVAGEPIRGKVVLTDANQATLSPEIVCAKISNVTVWTLTVASLNPNSGVSITVSPNDNNSLGNGVTQFTRSYDDTTVVTLTAPQYAAGNIFIKWQKDGADDSTNLIDTVTMGANHTMTAIYATVRKLTVTARNPDASAGAVAITVSPNDNNSLGNGTTTFTRDYNDTTVVSLTAPASINVGGYPYNFKQWNLNGAYQTTALGTTVTMSANNTMQAEYDCLPNNDANYSQWTSVSKPCCWCFPRQPRGDADGKSQGKSPNIYWVASNDLTVLTNAWQRTGTLTEPNICADFDHKSQGKSPNIYRVASNDLTILTNNWQQAGGPAGVLPGNRTPATCP